MKTRFAVFTGEASDDIERRLNAWTEEMEKTPGFHIYDAKPMPMDGEILYVLVRFAIP